MNTRVKFSGKEIDIMNFPLKKLVSALEAFRELESKLDMSGDDPFGFREDHLRLIAQFEYAIKVKQGLDTGE